MKKFSELKEKRDNLSNERKELLLEKQRVEEKIRKNYEATCEVNEEIGKCYTDYFESKKNKNFVLYENYPTGEILKQYILRNTEGFPLYDYGMWNVLELAEFIKQCFSFERQEEFKVMPIGLTRKFFIDNVPKLDANLFLLIGNEKTLEPYQRWNGKYVNNATHQDFSEIASKKAKDIVSISLNKTKAKDFTFQCFPTKPKQGLDGVYYYDYIEMEYKPANFSIQKQIYERSMRGVKDIQDVFTFPLSKENRFLADILVGIGIYKRNNGINELSGYDYYQIMHTLYGENVNIIEETQKDISRTLTYL